MPVDRGKEFCEDPLWDWDLSWNSERPRLTHCFRLVALTSVPCAFLWLITVIDLFISSRHRCGPLPWTSLTIFKQVMTSLLIVSTASEGFYHLSVHSLGSSWAASEYLTVSAKLITYTLCLILQLRRRRSGRLSSVKLTLFWTLMAGCQILASPFYNLITDDLERVSPFEFVAGMVSCSLVLGEAFLSHFTDPHDAALFPDPKTDEYLTDHKAPLSRLLFSWVDRLMYEGSRKLLSVEDLGALRPEERTSHVYERFLSSWRKSLRKTSRPSLCLALLRVMWPWLLVAFFLELTYDFVNLISPIILDWIIAYMTDWSEPWWHGPVYAVMLFCTGVFGSFLIAHTQNSLIHASVVPKVGLSAAIYRKVFLVSMDSRRGYSLGELCNLVTVDTQRIFQLVWSTNAVWSDPFKIVLTLTLLWRYLGVACLAGVGCMIALMPITGFLAFRIRRIQKVQMEWKDHRLRIMNDVLNGIKVLKLFAWEPAFMQRVREVREMETKALRKLQLMEGLILFIWNLAPFLVALCSFTTFVLIDEKNILTPSVAFVSLTLFGKLRGAMSNIPQVLSEIVQSQVAFRRVTDFLLCDERDTSGVEEPTAPDRVLELESASFSWSRHEEAFLKDVTLTVKQGDLVGIVGRVGSGKSALLSALLGNMTLKSGSVRMRKDVRNAYVAQSAWIQNATLRQNVLFVSPMEKRRYDSVIRKCCLKPDLKTLPAGDHTEIGEKGVNLSGGQRQRVGLARAAYHDAELYFLDDPLASVDAHLAKDIFDDVIGPKGMLAHKTRILVTHDLSLLRKCDTVLLLAEGRIVESGSYDELMRKDNGLLRPMVEESRGNFEENQSPDPSSLTPEQLKEQLRRMSLRQMSIETDQRPAKTKFIDSEKMQIGHVRAGIYWTYFRNAGFCMTVWIVSGFAAYQAFEIGSGLWLSGWSSDSPLPDGSQDVAKRNIRLTVYGAFGVAQGGCILLASILLALASTRASVRLHRTLLRRVMRAPLTFFETTPIGRILNRFGKDIQDIDIQIPAKLSSVATAVFAAIATLALICANHPAFLVLMLPVSIVYVFMQLFYARTSRQVRRLLAVTLSPILSFFSESVQGADTVRAFDCGDTFAKRQHANIDANCNVFLNTTYVNRWLGIRLQLLSAIIVAAVALLSVYRRYDYSAALIGLTLSYALNVTDLLNRMIRILTQLETSMVSVERVDEYTKMEEEAAWVETEQQLCLQWPTEGSIEFRGYTMKYRHDSEPALKSLDIEIPGGQKVGIVGRSGAGKSSLAQALFRTVEPSEGRLFIDGVDISNLGLHQLRSRLTVIPQEPVLFGGDLRSNLDPEGRHSDRELKRSLELAQFDSTGCPLDSELEEGGRNLSVGQRQQLCLARALLHRSRILVLDEATAAVDLFTDRLIQETVRSQFRECTVVTVAHRLHTVLDCDRILVMDQGRIVEDGPPDELLKRTNSHFRQLAQSAGLI